MKNILDDKIIVIICLTVIAIVCAVLFKQEALPVINSIVSGFLGMAIGNVRYNDKG